MKKVIRLTESDLARLVRSVLKEQSSGVVKVKAWTSREDRDKLAPRSYNLNITKLKLVNSDIVFDYDTPSEGYIGPEKGFGRAACGSKDNSISVDMGGKFKFLFLTPEGYKKVTKPCDSYVSNDTKMNGDYA
jgi:hypothetical protein